MKFCGLHSLSVYIFTEIQEEEDFNVLNFLDFLFDF